MRRCVMKSSLKKTGGIPSGTFREFQHDELSPNPQNPRRLFDKEQLQVLEDSIRKNGILVPLTVFQARNKCYYILDGERRWRCAEKIATDPAKPSDVRIPANVVDPPTNVANILYMFNIHNLREQWELMPTALSLKVLMEEMHEQDDEKLAELTKLSLPHVRRCKALLSFPPKYQQLMLDPDPDKRIKANFFIELEPVLDLYDRLPSRVRGGKTRDQLTEHFLSLYNSHLIPSVIHFRRILEANDFLQEDDDRRDEFTSAMHTLATNDKRSIRQLFDPLVAEDKSTANAEELCRGFLERLKKLKLAHTTQKRGLLRRHLTAVRKYVTELLVQLEE